MFHNSPCVFWWYLVRVTAAWNWPGHEPSKIPGKSSEDWFLTSGDTNVFLECQAILIFFQRRAGKITALKTLQEGLWLINTLTLVVSTQSFSHFLFRSSRFLMTVKNQLFLKGPCWILTSHEGTIVSDLFAHGENNYSFPVIQFCS